MKTIIEDAIEKSNARCQGLRENEYIKDGITYCKVCGAATTLKIFMPLFNEERTVRPICHCEKKRLEEEEAAIKERERINEINRLQEASLLGDRYKEVRFSNTETGHNEDFDKAYIRCRNYCDVSKEVKENGYGIYMYGDSGTGKTHLACAMVNELIHQRRQVLFTNFFEIAKVIKSTFSGKGDETNVINKFANVDFLFIDDLGTERVNNNFGEDNWLQEKIFEVINKRYNNKKPTVFTSNYSLQELVEDRGLMEKTVDRIMEMSNLVLKVQGGSFRMNKRKVDIPF